MQGHDQLVQIPGGKQQLQVCLLGLFAPSGNDLAQLDAAFSSFENISMKECPNADVADVEKLMSDIALRDIPGEERFRFRARASTLLEKWARITHSDDYGEICRPKASPYIPPEILTHIIRNKVKPTRLAVDWSFPGLNMHWPGGQYDCNSWNEDTHFLLQICAVSKDWHYVAKDILYKRKIRLVNAESIRLLTRTAQDPEIMKLIQHLLFINTATGKHLETEFKDNAAKLVSCCTNLRVLEGDLQAFSFPADLTLPEFPRLRELRIGNQNLHGIAPLLHRLPNLEVFGARLLASRGPLLLDRNLEELDGIPRPTFNLRELRLSQSLMMNDQYEWLLSSSKSIDYVELFEIGRDAGMHLAQIIGGSAKSLHIKGAISIPVLGDMQLLRSVPAYTTLTTLQVSGRHCGDWPWDNLLPSIKSTLKCFSISFSILAVTKLASALSDTSWQPSLEKVTVHHNDYFYNVTASMLRGSREKMEAACIARQVRLEWTTSRWAVWDGSDWQKGWGYPILL